MWGDRCWMCSATAMATDHVKPQPVEAPSSSSAPVIMSPSDLEPGRRKDSAAYGSMDEPIARFKR
jgi:hypothetical protein